MMTSNLAHAQTNNITQTFSESSNCITSLCENNATNIGAIHSSSNSLITQDAKASNQCSFFQNPESFCLNGGDANTIGPGIGFLAGPTNIATVQDSKNATIGQEATASNGCSSSLCINSPIENMGAISSSQDTKINQVGSGSNTCSGGTTGSSDCNNLIDNLGIISASQQSTINQKGSGTNGSPTGGSCNLSGCLNSEFNGAITSASQNSHTDQGISATNTCNGAGGALPSICGNTLSNGGDMHQSDASTINQGLSGTNSCGINAGCFNDLDNSGLISASEHSSINQQGTGTNSCSNSGTQSGLPETCSNSGTQSATIN